MFFYGPEKKPKKPSRPLVLWEERWSIGTVGGLILVLFIGCLIYWPPLLHWEVLVINYATFFPLVLDWEQFGSDINVLYTKNECGFGGYQENSTCLIALYQV